MSQTQKRRNSSVTLVHEGDRCFVRKRYVRTYTVADERAAYARLTPLLQGSASLRLPELYAETTDDELVMEFVPGRTLAWMLARGDVSALEKHREALCQLMTAALQRGYAFDLDPNNIIVSGDRLVLVDPVMMTLPLRHASAVIFLHGMAKISLKRILLLRRFATLRRAAEQVVARYLALSASERRGLLEDLAAYQVRVIEWNRREPAESRLISVARKTLLPLAYALFRQALLWRVRYEGSPPQPPAQT